MYNVIIFNPPSICLRSTALGIIVHKLLPTPLGGLFCVGNNLFIINHLYMNKSLFKFFKHFPESVIVAAPWDIEGKEEPVRKKWYDWDLEELRHYNFDKSWGIYLTTCDMKGVRHINSNFKDIRAWYCEIDLLSKEEEELPEKEREQLREERDSIVLGKILCCGELGLPQPSFVASSRNGYHVYWLAWHEEKMDDKYNPIGGLYKPSKENYEWIQSNIAKRLGGDPAAQKLVQLLRLPGFYNRKNGGKAPVRIMPELNNVQGGEFRMYCEDEWLELFGEPVEVKVKDNRKKARDMLKIIKLERYGVKDKKFDFDVFEYAGEMAQEDALMLFSGSKYVGGESYELQPHRMGYNIKINGKPSGCFIRTDSNTLSGNKKGEKNNGPKITQWVKWFNPHVSNRELASILKEMLCPNKK